MPSKVINELIDENGEFAFSLKKSIWVETFAKSDNNSQACKVANVHINTGVKWKKDPIMIKAVGRAKAMFANSYVDTDFIIGRINAISKASVSDYFNEDGDFVGFGNLTEIQKLCIKKFKKSRDKFGLPAYEIELFDSVDAGKLLAKPTGTFDPLNEDEEIAKLSTEQLEKEVEELDKQLGNK